MPRPSQFDRHSCRVSKNQYRTAPVNSKISVLVLRSSQKVRSSKSGIAKFNPATIIPLLALANYSITIRTFGSLFCGSYDTASIATTSFQIPQCLHGLCPLTLRCELFTAPDCQRKLSVLPVNSQTFDQKHASDITSIRLFGGSWLL
jgi:hypothetical protein